MCGMDETKLIDPANLVGTAELAHLFRVARTTVSGWFKERDTTHFPETVARVASGPLWDIEEVVAWYPTYNPRNGRPGRAPVKVGNTWRPADSVGVQGF